MSAPGQIVAGVSCVKETGVGGGPAGPISQPGRLLAKLVAEGDRGARLRVRGLALLPSALPFLAGGRGIINVFIFHIFDVELNTIPLQGRRDRPVALRGRGREEGRGG